MLWACGAAWMACGLLGHGLCFGYFRHEYPWSPWKFDFVFSLMLALLGPVHLIAVNLFLLAKGRPYRWQILP